MLKCLGLLSGLIAFCFPALADTGTVRVGVLAYQGSERAVRDWEPTFAHLNRSIPDRRFEMVALDLPGMVLAVADRRIDFVITNPGNYVTLEARFAVTRIATLESETAGSPLAALGSTIVRRADRKDIRDLPQLRGRTLAVVDGDAFGGFQIAWREMEDAGVRPFKDLRELRVVGFPMEAVLRAVRDGSADAGVLRTCLLEELTAQGRAGPDEFVVIGEQPSDLPCRTSSRLYPDWPFARLAHTSRDLARQVAATLLTMPATDGKGWTASLDYTSVHELFRQLHIGPYPRTAPTVADLFQDYWHWLLAVAAAALWWVVHVLRVEALVRRRTAELEREIAERKRAEAAALALREERDQLSRLGIVGEMASNIAHELNQPLAAIANFANGMTRILDSTNPDPGLLRSGARSVAEQAERAAAIIRRTRGFVRRRDAHRTLFEIDAVVTETLGLFAETAERRSVAIRFEPGRADDGLPLPPVDADRVEVQQVLLNLLQNAVDASLETGGSLITVTTGIRDRMVEVAVHDSGPGLADGAPARMFEPFYTTKPDGLGLGLSICRTIVERHGGIIRAEQPPEGGAIVRFALPPHKGKEEDGVAFGSRGR